MPYKDGTGPQGQGPMTGRGSGSCGDGRGKGIGMGRRMGFSRGRGFRSWFASLSKDQVKEELVSYKKSLEDELEQINAEQKKLEEEKGN